MTGGKTCSVRCLGVPPARQLRDAREPLERQEIARGFSWPGVTQTFDRVGRFRRFGFGMFGPLQYKYGLVALHLKLFGPGMIGPFQKVEKVQACFGQSTGSEVSL